MNNKRNNNNTSCLGCLGYFLVFCVILAIFKYIWIPGIIILSYLIIKKDFAKNKKYLIGSICVLLFSFIYFLSDTFAVQTPESISLKSKSITMDINSESTINYEINPEDADDESLEFISKDKNIVSVKQAKNNKIKLNSSKSIGTTTIYIKDKSGVTSNKIKVNVEDKTAIQKAKEEKERQQKLAEQKKKEAERQKKLAEQKKKEEQQKAEPTEEQVWIPSSGSKYHSNPNCSNMNNPSKVSISDAKSRGYTACKKCY